MTVSRRSLFNLGQKIRPKLSRGTLPATCPQCLPASARRWQAGFATRVSDSPEFRNSETGTRKRAGRSRLPARASLPATLSLARRAGQWQAGSGEAGGSEGSSEKKEWAREP